MLPSPAHLVCVVDDDPFVRAATSSLVRSFGWQSREFACAAEFLASPAARDADCLVSDIQMPEIDGLELLARLGSAGSPPRTLFVTAYASDRLREQALAAGALCVIEKPVDADELANWIRQALGHDASR